METRRDLETRLIGMGVTDDDALGLLLDETAAERHEHRCSVAEAAAKNYYLAAVDKTESDAGYWELRGGMAVLACADEIGAYSLRPHPHRAGSVSVFVGTRRHPAFAGCGKGRKFATDGGAWSAAIAHVAHMGPGCFEAIKDGDRWDLRYVGHECDVAISDWIGLEYLLGICQEGLRRATGIRQRHPQVPFQIGGSPTGWSTLVEGVIEKMIMRDNQILQA